MAGDSFVCLTRTSRTTSTAPTHRGLDHGEGFRRWTLLRESALQPALAMVRLGLFVRTSTRGLKVAVSPRSFRVAHRDPPECGEPVLPPPRIVNPHLVLGTSLGPSVCEPALSRA